MTLTWPQVAYGALIVSFLGAVHWGTAMMSVIGEHQAAASKLIESLWNSMQLGVDRDITERGRTWLALA